MSCHIDSLTETRYHIHAPKGEYIAQIRGFGCRRWETVGKAKTAELALAKAVKRMSTSHKRARVLWCSEWYDPNIVMEASRS